MVGHRHELGEGGVAEDGVVGQANVCDVEVDQLGVVVGLCAEGDCEPHLPQGVVRPSITPEKGLVGMSRS